MALTAGSLLGPYEIVAPLGAGGMGEVYKARDTRLERAVAIKILSSELAGDPSAHARFEREAKAVAALSHPNIVAIYDFGREGETTYAAIELLEGETLRERVRTPQPVRKVVEYGIQIAHGLGAAHGRGIIHRDLKPENVFVTTDGVVKILDFGLARQTAAAAATAGTLTPTVATNPGTVLGTVGYMSPEQARGEAGDHRSDLFSLGAVLYELACGRRAFQRGSATETLAAILRDDPPPLPASAEGSTTALDRVLRHCLEKNPAERFQSATDVAFALGTITGSGDSGHVAAIAPRAARSRQAWAAGLAALLLGVAIGTFVMRAKTPEAPVTRLAASLPPALPFGPPPSPGRALAISPDGRTIVYATGQNGRRLLHRRVLDATKVETIAGTDNAVQPFFSPDGKWLAFFTTTGELKKIPPQGGPAVTLVRGLQNGIWSFGAWRDDDVIVFSAFEALLSVPAVGGTPQPLTTVNAAANESYHHYPQVVPSTGDILFTVGERDGAAHLELLDWKTKARSRILNDANAAVLTSSSHLLFVRDGALMAVAFDAARKSIGSPVPLPEAVALDSPTMNTAQLAVSAAGTLVYAPVNADRPAPTLGWMSPQGTFTEVMTLPVDANGGALAPDGHSAAVQAGRKVYLVDLERRVTTLLDVKQPIVESLAWHPDGRRLTLGGPYLSLFDIDTGRETRLTESGRPKRFASWTPDGKTVAYMTFNPSNDIHVLTPGDGSAPRPLIASDAREFDPAISPDGKWIAYRSLTTDNGRTDVFVARFPDITGKTQVTGAGGGSPFWSRDGKSLYFEAPPGTLYRVPFAGTDRPRVGTTTMLFPTRDLDIVGVATDSSRFLVARVPQRTPTTELVVVQNWLKELTALVPSR
jgi:sugar lactone lactonase YvrE